MLNVFFIYQNGCQSPIAREFPKIHGKDPKWKSSRSSNANMTIMITILFVAEPENAERIKKNRLGRG